MDYAADAKNMRSDDIGEELLCMRFEVTGILDGSVVNSVWNGYGASLCVRGIIFSNEVDEDSSFFVQAQYMMAALGERIEKPRPPMRGKPRMTARHALSSKNPLCCQGCGRRPGFSNLAPFPYQWWVCGECKKPTEQWFRSQGDDVLNKFTGGPLDGMVYSSSSLLNDSRMTNLILGYDFTPEVIKSEITGAIARVWMHNPGRPGSVSPVSTTPNETSTNGRGKMTATQESTETPAENAIPAPPAPAPEPVDVSDLETTRKRLGLSRTPVSEAAGVTVAQLARIEKGGPRTTAAEAKQVRDALAKLEAEAPAPAAPAADAEGGTPDPA